MRFIRHVQMQNTSIGCIEGRNLIFKDSSFVHTVRLRSPVKRLERIMSKCDSSYSALWQNVGKIVLSAAFALGVCGLGHASLLDVAPVAVIESKLEVYQPKLTLSGSIAARSHVNTSFRINGQVVARFVEVGEHVQKGQLLAQIDDVEQAANLKVAQASEDAARAKLVQVEANFKRQEILLKQGFTTRSQYDQAQQLLRTAQSELSTAQSALAIARDEFSYTELHAPVTGIVTARNIEIGQVVQAAQTAFSIAVDGPRDAIFDVHEMLVSHARFGMEVAVALVSDETITTEGRIREISPVVDEQTGTVRMKVGLQQTPQRMALGATVKGTIRMDQQNVVIVPWSAITSDSGNPAVWRVAKDTHVVTLVPIRVLAYENERAIIASGIGEGELIVVRGAQMLRVGEPTEVLEVLGKATTQ